MEKTKIQFKKKKYSVREAIIEVCLQSGYPMDTKEIFEEIKDVTNLNGKTPVATVSSQVGILCNDAKILDRTKNQDGNYVYFIDKNKYESEEEAWEETKEKESRYQIEKSAESKWNTFEKSKSDEMIKIVSEFNKMFSTVEFAKDHASSIHEHQIKAHHPDNFQIITKRDNGTKNSTSCKRMTWEKQKKYLETFFEAEKLSINGYDESLKNHFEYCLSRLELLF